MATDKAVSLGRKFLSLTRIGIGFVFLWAFLDKLFALGFHTGRNDETGEVDYFGDASWLQGYHVTEGYLKSAAGEFGGDPGGLFGSGALFTGWGDFAIGAFRPLDWLFMLGLLGVGLALMLGIGTRIGAWSAVGLLMLMYLAHFDNTNNPFLDDHIVYSLAVLGIVHVELDKQAIGIGKWWRGLSFVQKNPWLI